MKWKEQIVALVEHIKYYMAKWTAYRLFAVDKLNAQQRARHLKIMSK